MVAADAHPGAAPAGSTAGRKRILIMVLAGVAVLAAIFLVSKVLMPHAAPSNPIGPTLSAPGKARAVAAASNAATAKLNGATGSTAGSTTTIVPATAGAATGTATKAAAAAAGQTGGLTGPPPNTTRNPFLP